MAGGSVGYACIESMDISQQQFTKVIYHHADRTQRVTVRRYAVGVR